MKNERLSSVAFGFNSGNYNSPGIMNGGFGAEGGDEVEAEGSEDA